MNCDGDLLVEKAMQKPIVELLVNSEVSEGLGPLHEIYLFKGKVCEERLIGCDVESAY